MSLIWAVMPLPGRLVKVVGSALAAEFYLWHWQRRLLSDLPGARVVLCRDGKAWDSPVFQWSCPSVEDESSPWVLKLGWPDRRGAVNFYPSIVLNVGIIP